MSVDEGWQGLGEQDTVPGKGRWDHVVMGRTIVGMVGERGAMVGERTMVGDTEHYGLERETGGRAMVGGGEKTTSGEEDKASTPLISPNLITISLCTGISFNTDHWCLSVCVISIYTWRDALLCLGRLT